MTDSHYPGLLIIGAGNMGTSIAAGLLNKQWPVKNITFCDHKVARHDALKQQFPGCDVIEHPADVNADPEIILLAIKPKDMQAVCKQLGSMPVTNNTLFISIAAGVPISAFKSWLGCNARIIRCMPNTPSAIGIGMTGLYGDSNVNQSDQNLANQILSCTGKTIWVDKETMLDAVTALSGSGPAYLFYFMQCLQESGQALGFNSHDSYILTLQTMLGAAQLAEHQNIDFEKLRANVTSKGGTTEQAINSFMQDNLKAAVDNAVKAAAKKASEISQSFTKE